MVDWEQVLEAIRKKSNPQVFFWFSPLKVVSQDSQQLLLKANSSFDRDWINNHYMDFIAESVKEIYSTEIAVKITCDSEQAENETPANNAGLEKISKPSNNDARSLFSGFLNPNYTFDNFIVGPSNQFAHAASLAVARKPGQSYNPLFIYGGVGLGKTHLLNAVGNHISAVTSNHARVCSISAEHFTNEVINSIKSNKMEHFRNKYRVGCDVLLIDDIQFIAGKESTQEEFFHTFNTLYESKKQIILTSDKSPKDMSYLEERLRSRFQWGLITDIQPPETETRIAILKKKAESENIVIPDEVANFLAQNIISNVRELEGTLTNIIGYAKLLNSQISVDLAKEVLKNILKNDDRKVLSIETIQKEVSNYFGIKINDIKSNKKQKNIAFPRQISMYLVRRYTGASFPEIGEKFGGKDHSTVIHAVNKIEKLLEDDLSVKNTVNSLSRSIESLRG
ncbi:MAG: chromosomal replication initiator protein DnaA [Candidatus Dadabacteria bacterium]|nr:chromosomal replication initiator protein DnaA [Candidatus Dadabacteria bacterium]NIS07960.1 chromosomal replication initiator protein DnaA [Candidatus Dadabacteria bacterium]NIV43053.1 chromosomal replication initiator protein DnaA [Candidatus Dadabacteria bacterium]NIX14916.1 chromosomal replication initiator protein DnaA [Candidatus Dadabacteria bacterium]NIY21544.1 chromosomal replication initiator protein DnaA [Candidatus Dadabacteria bacterium]